MMSMGHRSFLAIVLLLLCASAVAQSVDGGNGRGNDYARLYEEAITKRDSLESVKKTLEARREVLRGEIDKAKSKADMMESRLADSRDVELRAAKAKYAKSGHAELFAECEQLMSSITELVADTAELDRDIARVNDEMTTLRGFKSGLDEMQAGDFDSMVAEHSSYLDRSFDDISQEALREIVDDCLDFVGYDRAKPFIARVRAVQSAKSAYDEVLTVLGRPFDRDDVARAKNRLQSLEVQGLSKAQRDGLTWARRGLDNFGRGLEAFRTFIGRLNVKLHELSNYNAALLEFDLPSLLGRDDGDIDAWARDNGIRDVPYLDKAFDEYINIIKSDPTAHPDIETEILDQ